MGEQCTPAAGVRRGEPCPPVVRAAVDHRAAHSLQRGEVMVVQSPDDPRDATHRLGSTRKPDVDYEGCADRDEVSSSTPTEALEGYVVALTIVLSQIRLNNLFRLVQSSQPPEAYTTV